MILPICVISLYCNIKDLFETRKYLYKSGSPDDKCIDSQHFGTCDSHTDFKVKSQGHGAAAYCGEHQESCHLANGCRYNVIKILLNTTMLIIIQSNHFRVNSAV